MKDDQDKQNKPSWDAYFLAIAQVAKRRADCLGSLHVGAVIVKDKYIVATGYNGTPIGIKNCSEGGCDRCSRRSTGELKEGEEKEKCICVHAEQNAIAQAAYHGISTKGATLYATVKPCSACAKLIINAGIRTVVYGSDYINNHGETLLKQAGITIFSGAEAVSV